MSKVIDKQIRTIQNGERMQVVREKTIDRKAAKKKAAKFIDKIAVTDAELADALAVINDEIDAINTTLASLPSVSPKNLLGVQANLTAITAVQSTTFIPFTTATTNNNPNLTVNVTIGQITVNTAGTYLVNWVVIGDNPNAVALTLNGNVAAAIATTGSYLLTASVGDIIGLMNVAGGVLNVTAANLNVVGIA